MELSDLARKQKRIKSWTSFLNNEVSDDSIRAQTVEALKLYRNYLSKCWEQRKISAEDKLKIEDLERQLEQLNEDARLRSGASKPISNSN